MEKNIWIIANWKANKTVAEALDWVSKVGSKIPKYEQLKVVVCPRFSVLAEVKKAVIASNFPLLVGAQDLSAYGAGAYTGEEPAELLHDFCDLAILGHSERKKYFNETDEMIANKSDQALAYNMIPLVCVQDENTVVPDDCSVIAYEPVWAISTGLTNSPGTGIVDDPKDANKIAGLFKAKYGQSLQVLYGGSIDSGNVKGFITQENLSGVLVGNASLDATEFLKICKNCAL